MSEVLHEPGLRGGLATVLATAMLSAPLVTFCPVLVKEVFQGDAGDFSIALGAFGVGGLVGAIGLLALDPLQGVAAMLAHLLIGRFWLRAPLPRRAS